MIRRSLLRVSNHCTFIQSRVALSTFRTEGTSAVFPGPMSAHHPSPQPSSLSTGNNQSLYPTTAARAQHLPQPLNPNFTLPDGNWAALETHLQQYGVTEYRVAEIRDAFDKDGYASAAELALLACSFCHSVQFLMLRNLPHRIRKRAGGWPS